MPIKSFSLNSLGKLLSPIQDKLKDSNIILSINYFRLGLPDYSFDDLLSFFLEDCQVKQLAIQSYSEFDSRDHRCFYRFSTPVTKYLSTVSKQAFIAAPEKRLLSPTHSFILYGADQSLYSKIFTSAFGEDSVFGYFLNQNFYWLNLGSKLTETCTFMHHVESQYNTIIKYRSNVSLPVIIYPDANRTNSLAIDYEYFASSSNYPEITFDWSPLNKNQYILDENFGPTELVCSMNSLIVINREASKIITKDSFAFTTHIS